MVKIIPDQRLPFHGAGAHAERKTLEYLKSLPDEYYVLRECKITPSSAKQRSGSQEDRSDFILIGPHLGIIVLEVKDWNIRSNRFHFTNQYHILKTDIKTGTETVIDNPWHQVSEYRNALQELLAQRPRSPKLWVSSFVVYPKLSRAEFENVFVGQDVHNPQSRYLYDPGTTIFQEDINVPPTQLLDRLARLVNKSLIAMHRAPGILSCSQEQVETTVDALIPSEMRIGGLPQNESAAQKLAFLDAIQQEWAFSNALDNKQYLADVAGSGKTNVLLSRAIYWAKQHIDTGGCRVLVTTYSKALPRRATAHF